VVRYSVSLWNSMPYLDLLFLFEQYCDLSAPTGCWPTIISFTPGVSGVSRVSRVSTLLGQRFFTTFRMTWGGSLFEVFQV